MTTAVENTAEQDKPKSKGTVIPGAVWPDPKLMDFQIDRRDPFTRMDRDASYRKPLDTDLRDER